MHSPEPWTCPDYQVILDAEDVPVINGDCDDPRWPDEETCERITACVNACKGIPDDNLKRWAATVRVSDQIRSTMGLQGRFPPTAEQLQEFVRLHWGVDVEIHVPHYDKEINT